MATDAVGDDTIVLFCTDHGCHFRTRNGEYKRSCHESSIRVPTVFSGPGFEGGGTVTRLVDLLDWPATLMDAAGIPAPAMRGRSILPLVREEKVEWRDEVFIQISESHVGRALRTPRWTYSVRAPARHGWNHSGADRYVEDFLYDLEADPHQEWNLAASPAHSGIRAKLAARLKARMTEAGESEPTIEPARGEMK